MVFLFNEFRLILCLINLLLAYSVIVENNPAIIKPEVIYIISASAFREEAISALLKVVFPDIEQIVYSDYAIAEEVLKKNLEKASLRIIDGSHFCSLSLENQLSPLHPRKNAKTVLMLQDNEDLSRFENYADLIIPGEYSGNEFIETIHALYRIDQPSIINGR